MEIKLYVRSIEGHGEPTTTSEDQFVKIRSGRDRIVLDAGGHLFVLDGDELARAAMAATERDDMLDKHIIANQIANGVLSGLRQPHRRLFGTGRPEYRNMDSASNSSE